MKRAGDQRKPAHLDQLGGAAVLLLHAQLGQAEGAEGGLVLPSLLAGLREVVQSLDPSSVLDERQAPGQGLHRRLVEWKGTGGGGGRVKGARARVEIEDGVMRVRRS